MIQKDVLLAVCDAIVTKNLETLGKRIIREDRSRYAERRHRALDLHVVHTQWCLSPQSVDRALTDAWETVPFLLSAYGADDDLIQRITPILDTYTRELLNFRIPHTSENLARRFERDL